MFTDRCFLCVELGVWRCRRCRKLRYTGWRDRTPTHAKPAAAARIAYPDQVRHAKSRAAVYGILACRRGLQALRSASSDTPGALVADAIESSADAASSTIVLGGLSVAERDADRVLSFSATRLRHCCRRGRRADAFERDLRNLRCRRFTKFARRTTLPWWTLLVLVVVLPSGGFHQWVRGIASQIDKPPSMRRPGHHASDALTSAAAFVGISVALVGGRLGGSGRLGRAGGGLSSPRMACPPAPRYGGPDGPVG